MESTASRKVNPALLNPHTGSLTSLCHVGWTKDEMASNNQIRILCFGDSLTAGTPGHDPMFGGQEKFQYAYWLVKLAESEGWQSIAFSNHGVPGDLAKSMPRRLNRAVASGEYDFAIILAGSNDLGWDYAPASVYSSLRELWSIAIGAGIRL